MTKGTDLIEKRARLVAPMPPILIRIQDSGVKQKTSSSKVWIAHVIAGHEKTSAHFFASRRIHTNANKGSWLLGPYDRGESLSSTRNVQEFIRHPWVRWDEPGTGVCEEASASSSV